MEKLIEAIRGVEAQALALQQTVGRGPGGKELSTALTKLAEARLWLGEGLAAPATTPFSETKRDRLGQ